MNTMVAKTTSNRAKKPSAWIVSPKDKGRKSIKKGKVFLNDGDEFEIELFNPLTECVLADIKLNGQSISKTGLVIKPGQRCYLDCFIDDKKKFIFSTYEIESSLDAIEATEKNGLLEVFFYKEDVVSINNWKNRFDKVIIERWYPSHYPWYTNYPWYNPNVIYFNSGTTTIGTGIGTTSNAFYGTTSNAVFGGSTYTTGVDVNYSSNNISTTGTVDLTSLNAVCNSSLSNNLTPINSSMETGRVEKGSSSSQKFTQVDMDFESNYISSTIIEILPESRKPAEVKNVKVNIELPKGDWSKEKIEEAKEVVQNFLWKENTDDTQKEMYKNIDLIKKLSELHTAGILTDDEFTSKKSELLSKI